MMVITRDGTTGGSTLRFNTHKLIFLGREYTLLNESFEGPQSAEKLIE
jgi:hypothetical protein